MRSSYFKQNQTKTEKTETFGGSKSIQMENTDQASIDRNQWFKEFQEKHQQEKEVKKQDFKSYVKNKIDFNKLDSRKLIEEFESLCKEKKDRITTSRLFRDAKNTIRDNQFSEIREGLMGNNLTVEQALLQILDSPIGQTDQHSVKYQLLTHFFDFYAANDNEARKIVKYSIEVLKQRVAKQYEKNVDKNLKTPGLGMDDVF